MKKKDYERPHLKVYELEQQSQLLAGSGTEGSRSPYGTPNNFDF